MYHDFGIKHELCKIDNNSSEDKTEQLIMKIINPLINEIYNIEETEQKKNKEYILNDEINEKIKNKKRKIKKMKNYNIRKGDWQCNNCNNINFHFRTVCNICKNSKFNMNE